MADVGSLGTRLLRIVLGLCALVLVLLALYVSLGRQLVPLVAEYRQQLEDEAGKATRHTGADCRADGTPGAASSLWW